MAACRLYAALGLHVNGSGLVDFLEPDEGQVALVFVKGFETGDAITVEKDEQDIPGEVPKPPAPPFEAYSRQHRQIDESTHGQDRVKLPRKIIALSTNAAGFRN
jgi:hypothetical protein